jgi:hypothetical protein
MTLLELQAERDRLISESVQLQAHIQGLKAQAREMEEDLAWEERLRKEKAMEVWIERQGLIRDYLKAKARI